VPYANWQKECDLISLKKYLEMDVKVKQEATVLPPPSTPATAPESSELLMALIAAYRSALLAMGENGFRACPAVGTDLQQSLSGLESRFAGEVNTLLAKETEKQVQEELQQWSGNTEVYFKAKVDDVKELMIVLARTAESVGDRDQKYAKELNLLTTGLQTIANLEDITQVRSTLVKKASELKTYVDKMAQDSQKLVVQLKGEVSSYETKLKEAEQLAMRDEVTRLPNRRNVESRIEWRIEHRQAFCLAVLDMNGFKQVNDQYGHQAGDELLKQFSGELRSALRSSDVVGRWGGDEFILVLDCELSGAAPQLERIQKWVFGDYTIPLGDKGDVKIHVEAAIGIVQWNDGETVQQVIERADKAMYKNKRSR
jgi:diguanylate cyclase (GGDEF)-like protein